MSESPWKTNVLIQQDVHQKPATTVSRDTRARRARVHTYWTSDCCHGKLFVSRPSPGAIVRALSPATERADDRRRTPRRCRRRAFAPLQDAPSAISTYCVVRPLHWPAVAAFFSARAWSSVSRAPTAVMVLAGHGSRQTHHSRLAAAHWPIAGWSSEPSVALVTGLALINAAACSANGRGARCSVRRRVPVSRKRIGVMMPAGLAVATIADLDHRISQIDCCRGGSTRRGRMAGA